MACQTARSQPAEGEAVLASEPQQEILGWGCYPYRWRTDRDPVLMDIAKNPPIAKWLYEDLNMTIMRWHLFATFYDEETGGLITEGPNGIGWLRDQIKYGLETGNEKDWIIVTWSPPAPFKTNGELIKGSLREDKEEDFARFYAECIRWLVDEGCKPPLAASVQNEGDFDPKNWPGCRYTGPQMARVAKLLRKEFDRRELTDVKVMVGEGTGVRGTVMLLDAETSWDATDYSMLAQDEEYRDAIAFIATHTYGKGENFDEFRKIAEQWPQFPHWITEQSCITQLTQQADYDGSGGVDYFENAMWHMRRLCRDMNVQTLQYWLTWLGWEGNSSWGGGILVKGTRPDNYTQFDLFLVLEKLWSLVPADSGYRARPFVSSSVEGLTHYNEFGADMMSFTGPDRTVVLLTNPTAEAKAFPVKGLEGASYQHWMSTKEVRMEEQPSGAVADGVLRVNLSPFSIHIYSVPKSGSGDSR